MGVHALGTEQTSGAGEANERPSRSNATHIFCDYELDRLSEGLVLLKSRRIFRLDRSQANIDHLHDSEISREIIAVALCRAGSGFDVVDRQIQQLFVNSLPRTLELPGRPEC